MNLMDNIFSDRTTKFLEKVASHILKVQAITIYFEIDDPIRYPILNSVPYTYLILEHEQNLVTFSF